MCLRLVSEGYRYIPLPLRGFLNSSFIRESKWLLVLLEMLELIELNCHSQSTCCSSPLVGVTLSSTVCSVIEISIMRCKHRREYSPAREGPPSVGGGVGVTD